MVGHQTRLPTELSALRQFQDLWPDSGFEKSPRDLYRRRIHNNIIMQWRNLSQACMLRNLTHPYTYSNKIPSLWHKHTTGLWVKLHSHSQWHDDWKNKLLCARVAESGVNHCFTLSVCLSVCPQTSFYDRGTTKFQFNVIFFNTNRKMNRNRNL